MEITRGIRNKNPFNIKRSENSWLGKCKYSKDTVFEQFQTMDLGVRAGIQLLLNAYVRKGYNTIEEIIKRYAPSSENDCSKYIEFVSSHTHILPDQEISVGMTDFFLLCQAICLYESKYYLEYDKFVDIVHKYHLF